MHWICDHRRLPTEQPPGRQPGSDGWRIHGLGCIRLSSRAGVLSVAFDGRGFDWEMCDRLVAEIEQRAETLTRIEFAVWTGAGESGGWIRHDAAGVAEAARFVRNVAVVGTASDTGVTISTQVLRLERLLLERRGVFDEVLAAWLLDRRAGSPAIANLFLPRRERPDEGLKVVRRVADNLVFDAYRLATAHSWVADQRQRMPGGDLAAVLDRRLAQNLRHAVRRSLDLGEPLLERVTGVMETDSGRRLSDYLRLSLPLRDPTGDGLDRVIIATRW